MDGVWEGQVNKIDKVLINQFIYISSVNENSKMYLLPNYPSGLKYLM